MSDAQKWKYMTDWSDMPDMYVVQVESDGILWKLEAHSVPLALVPEVRLIRADRVAALIREAEARGMERAAEHVVDHAKTAARIGQDQANGLLRSAEAAIRAEAAALRGKGE